jgi:DNA adenine methylase
MTEAAPSRPQRLRHFTPLRYPGGKGKLASFVKSMLKVNGLLDGEYVEPYAGGAAIALELLLHEYVSHIHINDVSRPIYSFWESVLNHTEDLARLIRKTKLTVAQWDRQKKILSHPDDHDDLALGFATFFLNRTNRSGILNGGIIGGRDQTGPWKIDARFNAPELVTRITAIARMGGRISLTRKDALKFLVSGSGKWPQKTLVYLDPPYYVKGRQLYHDFYRPEDHAKVAAFVTGGRLKQKWMVSYDNVKQIRDLYASSKHITYDIAYSARSASTGSEVMFFADDVNVPPGLGAVKSKTKQRKLAR